MSLEDLLKQYGIGLTGGIATGKSTIARILEGFGFPVIDADLLGRRVVEPSTAGLAAVVGAFGGQILSPDGALDRKKLAELIFTDERKRLLLEDIIHPRIQEALGTELEKRLLFQVPRPWFYEASLICEKSKARMFKEVWVVHCPRDLQFKRLKARDPREERILHSIIQSQWPSSKKLPLASVTIDTSSPLEELEAKVKEALQQMQRRF